MAIVKALVFAAVAILPGCVAQQDVDEALSIADQISGDAPVSSLLRVGETEEPEKSTEAQVAVDAKNAHSAAKMAKQAAKVAKKVATHSAEMASHAKAALKHAHDAVNRARVETEGLSAEQKHSLKEAEKRLKEATKTAEYGEVKDAKYVKAKAADKTLKKLHDKMEDVKKRELENQSKPKPFGKAVEAKPTPPPAPVEKSSDAAAPVSEKSLDIDTAMPYGDLEPFGREDTAQELTEASIRESDKMVDQLERAEVAEEKRAVFRALTRLRGAAITSYDGVARSQTGNIDEYNHNSPWRSSHPLHHLADEESDVSKWAFPENAD